RLNKYTYVMSGHLLWGAFLNAGNYGNIRVGKRIKKVHRVAWETAYGEIPEGMYVLHTCDTPPCILPWHLYLGSQIDNMQDSLISGNNANINKTRCKQGHKFTVENTYISPTNKRSCRICRRTADTRRYYRDMGD
ncbi:hypothetical protein LCGC14_3121970, partial [marine sediment metagenome]